MITIIGLALGLSMDAFSVSITNGCIIHELKLRHAIRIAFSFGLFQAIMPLIGWATGSLFSSYIQSFDHWIAFGLLSFIGIKMIYDSRKRESENKTKDCRHYPTLFILSIATSIDALAVGVSFAFLNIQIIFPVLLIGIITFIVCLIGIFIGNRIGKFFETGIELFGGLILIGIGIKILIEHLFF
ncbi:MAG: manganese efflux pump [Spirochaetales bacterium]|nr:manganese efflux pump [Spirochaetales bacterium]